MTGDYDAVVVGAGAGGAAAAWRMTQRGWRVLLLDAGPSFDPVTDYGLDRPDWEKERFRHKPGSEGEVSFAPMQLLDPALADLRSWSAAQGPSNREGRRGVLVDLTVPLTGAPVQLGEFHVKGLDGTRSVQGELGVGYGFQGEAFLVNGGVRVPYVNAGTDYLFGKGWQPYVGIDTMQRARPHTETTQTSCTPPAILSGGLCILPPPPGAG